MTTRCGYCPFPPYEKCPKNLCKVIENKKKWSEEQRVMKDANYHVHPAVRATNKVMMSLPYMGDKTKTYAYAQAIATALIKEK